MNTKRILLAEDNPNDIELTLEALSEQNLGNRVDVVNDGVKVLEYLRCQSAYAEREPLDPLLILLDLKMPNMNGYEVLAELRQGDVGARQAPDRRPHDHPGDGPIAGA